MSSFKRCCSCFHSQLLQMIYPGFISPNPSSSFSLSLFPFSQFSSLLFSTPLTTFPFPPSQSLAFEVSSFKIHPPPHACSISHSTFNVVDPPNLALISIQEPSTRVFSSLKRNPLFETPPTITPPNKISLFPFSSHSPHHQINREEKAEKKRNNNFKKLKVREK